MENTLRDFGTSPTSKSSSQAADSEHLTDIRHGHKRQKLTSSSSRGVANLTPEQLAKKRANDREAQRAIRERTKSPDRDLGAENQGLDLATAISRSTGPDQAEGYTTDRE